MRPLIAIIAMNSKAESCQERNFFALRYAQQGGMEIIDADWVRRRLTGRRGEKAELARAMGVKPDVVAKILKGERRVQPNEMPAVLRFFNPEASLGHDEITQRLLAQIPKLTAQERGLVLAAVEGMLSQHREEEL